MPDEAFPFITRPHRDDKPRQTGLTHVLDKGLGIQATQDRIDIAGRFVDIWKLGFGTCGLYDTTLLGKKRDLLDDAQIAACPGGTFMEVAYAQQKVPAYLDHCKELGFRHVEVSNGVVEMSQETKCHIIHDATDRGLTVLSEVGRKRVDEDAQLSPQDRVNATRAELDAGSWKVVMEARESGTVGIFAHDQVINEDVTKTLFGSLDLDQILFEAPNTKQQAWLVNKIGNTANLGNIHPDDILSVETLRTGLRGDTLPWLQPVSE